MLHFKFHSIVVANLRRLMLLLAATALVLSTTAAQADLGDQLFKLLADDGTAGNAFGRSVTISGVTAIVGASDDSDNGLWSGSAYLFDTTTRQQIAKLLPEDGAALDFFGYSVAISGTTAIVGARMDDDNGIDSGSAYLFDITTGQQIAKLLPNDGEAGDYFGTSVAISGTTAIVGAPEDDDNDGNSGSAYLFDTTTGQQIAKLLPSDGAAGDEFGYSVAIHRASAVVGARGDHDNGNRSGSAYVFHTTSGEQNVKLLPYDGAANDEFGTSVSIRGEIAIIGAPEDRDNGVGSGSAYMFNTITGEQIAKLLPSDGSPLDRFGISVAIGSVTAIVGASGDEDNGDVSGSAYLFDTITGQQIAKLLPDDGAAEDYFGRSGAISGTTAIVGAFWNDDNGIDSGSAYVFAAAFCPWDLDDDGAVGPFDLAFLLGFWGPNPDHPADLDSDGEVGPFDLALLLGNWGSCPAVVCLDPKEDSTYLSCFAIADCDVDGDVIEYGLSECHCLGGISEERCCDEILEGFESSCESSGGILLNFICNCIP